MTRTLTGEIGGCYPNIIDGRLVWLISENVPLILVTEMQHQIVLVYHFKSEDFCSGNRNSEKEEQS